ncbi:hypothetical protein PVL29_009420 [Vitis rotundifolia]|uniref:FAR1 domain-containing protein n=1 Tax=Vitis rotundifolia TaxID=103349 RepID=A0AA39DUN1_VITRO|nr:hypothetical protein PVL29_009420 [Vitis rotundifolia]
MESTSSQAIDSDEGDRCLQVESYNEHEIADDEPSTNGNLHIGGDDKTLAQSVASPHSIGNDVEPYVGMEFKSREDAREFYIAYGRHTGFTVRIHHNRRSRIDNNVIGQDFVCSREGFREKKYIYRKDRILPPPPITREGCSAMLRVAIRDGPKWVITKFVKEHNHKLMSPSKVPWRGSGKNFVSEDEKDRRIQELTLELNNERQKCKRQCAAYQEQLRLVLKDIEEHTDHLSRGVEDAVQKVRDLENEHQQ